MSFILALSQGYTLCEAGVKAETVLATQPAAPLSCPHPRRQQQEAPS